MILAGAIADWANLLEPGESLLWSGQPNFASLAALAGIVVMFSLLLGPGLLLLLGLPVSLFYHFARDAYALTDRRILLHSHPFGDPPRLIALPRSGTWPSPSLSRGARSLIFTATDHRSIHFRLLDRRTVKHLVRLYYTAPGTRAQA